MKVSPIILAEDSAELERDADELRRAVVGRLSVPVWVFDIDRGHIVFANQPACELWGAETEEELCARDMSKDMSSTVATRLKQYQADFVRNDALFTELWTLFPKGVPRNIQVIFRGFPLSDGRMAMQCEAVGESEDAPENLRSAEAVLHTDVMIALYSTEGQALYKNPAARNAFPEAEGRISDLFVDPEEYDAFLERVNFLGEYRLVTKLRTAEGHRWIDISAKACSDAVTGKPAFLTTAIDVSELKEAKDKARYLADRDQLTNLYNRTYLQSYFESGAHSRKSGATTVLFFDLDRFKLVNDRYGHEVGDVVLRTIATRVRSVLRAQDMVVRLGGDEFVVVLENESDSLVIEDCVARIRAAVAKVIAIGSIRLETTISVGVAICDPKDVDFGEALRQADIALYASKQKGRDRVTFFSPEMGEAVKARDTLEYELKRAVAENQFVLHYQPRVDLASGQIVSVEGLVRWKHPDRGLVMPDEFIPVCEETGLIEDLGRLVLEIGCAQAIAWRRDGLELSLSLNVSPRQFVDPTFLDTLEELSRAPGFPSGAIELEVTENVLIGEHTQITEKLHRITKMGFKIAVDDFGTGYSNLSYILAFPLTCLKIDRSFVDQLPKSGPIVKLILTLGKEIGARVVSEGVETEEQLRWLMDHACEEVQGYLFSKPVSADALVKLYHVHRMAQKDDPTICAWPALG